MFAGKGSPRIVFYGTPEFAVPSLDALVREGYPVAAVVTAPDKPAGRGLRDKPSAVKEYAVGHAIPVLQPVSLKDPSFLAALSEIRPDLQIVIAFRILPRPVWQAAPLGTFNLHASLLPQYRGAAPINRAIMNGETETGVTTFFLNDGIDTGKILLSEKTGIGLEETAGELHDRLMGLGARLVVRTVGLIEKGEAAGIPQDPSGSLPPLRPAPKIFREDCRIDWQRPAGDLHNFIRGLSPYPGAFTTLHSGETVPLEVKILRATHGPGSTGFPPGQFVTGGKDKLMVGTGSGLLSVLELRPEGRKTMSAAEFLRGWGRLLPKTPDI